MEEKLPKKKILELFLENHAPWEHIKAHMELDEDLVRFIPVFERLILAYPQPLPTIPDEFAALVGMISENFRYHFKRRTGIGFMQFLWDYQMLLAMRLILKGEKLSDVTKAVGFQGQSWFTARFKKIVGQVPMEWYRKMKAKEFDLGRKGQSVQEIRIAEFRRFLKKRGWE